MAARPHRVTPKRFHPWLALRSAWSVLRDPENTAAGARLVLCFEGGEAEQNYDRFKAHPVGVRILAGAPTAFDLLRDHEALRALPEGSLGRAFLDFVETEGISTEGLDEVVGPVEEELIAPSLEARRYLRHTRATHDLWHVLTGYSRDLLGELLLLDFSYVQLGRRPFGWIVRLAKLGIERKLPGSGARALLADAEARAARAEWLATADWQSLLALPLDEVRERLRLGPPPVYTRYFRAPQGIRVVPESELQPAA
jgi:ubiquinone biosynthesis protein COQ4